MHKSRKTINMVWMMMWILLPGSQFIRSVVSASAALWVGGFVLMKCFPLTVETITLPRKMHGNLVAC